MIYIIMNIWSTHSRPACATEQSLQVWDVISLAIAASVVNEEEERSEEEDKEGRVSRGCISDIFCADHHALAIYYLIFFHWLL